MNEQKKVTDPVCLMEVEKGNIENEYQGIFYSFCSKQCLERFKANPHLYVGQPAKPSPKQQGKSVIRKRILKMDTLIPGNVKNQIYDSLGTMMGVIEITIKDNIIGITYDLLQVTTKQMEDVIQGTGQYLANDWATRLKRAFIHYVEDTELDNLEHQDGSHGCHR